MYIRFFVVTFFLVGIASCASSDNLPEAPPIAFAGRWDVTVKGPSGGYPSWWEFVQQGDAWGGRFVGRVGSARPIAKMNISGSQFEFSLPVQYETHKADMVFRGEMVVDRLEGRTNAEDGSELTWVAVRAPGLATPADRQWGEPIELFNGKNLGGWKPRHAEMPNGWEAQRGMLVNRDKGSDLVTEDAFGDFKLHVEFQYPEQSNSGVYLRGRYEVQVQDDFGKEPSSLHIGGVYGFLAPTKNNAKKAGEWQSFDITLLGRRVTVVLNGETVIEDREIAGITGGALDSAEGQPGPVMIQGDHGPISYRNIVLTPAL